MHRGDSGVVNPGFQNDLDGQDGQESDDDDIGHPVCDSSEEDGDSDSYSFGMYVVFIYGIMYVYNMLFNE